ncbi:UvrD-helicase domain-containing protein [Streptomyces asoensis]|uniref:UvrD-helicase domain-containing protein n=1 Tax=Streptomyces asoensis TaxID=249586 RepID=UPI0036872350
MARLQVRSPATCPNPLKGVVREVCHAATQARGHTGEPRKIGTESTHCAPHTLTLTDEQQAAVTAFTTGRNLVLQAGAGTGKTSTLELKSFTGPLWAWEACPAANAGWGRSHLP